MPKRLGYACICTQLRSQGIYCSRTSTLETVRKRGTAILIEHAKANIADLQSILEWNDENTIKFFRMSSQLLPRISDYAVSKPTTGYFSYDPDCLVEPLEQIGSWAKDHGHRLTFHPGQFCQVGATDSSVLSSTIAELYWHAWVLETMKLGPESVMIVHMGGWYSDREETKKRWVEQFRQLPAIVRSRLVLENCEKWSVDDVLETAQGAGIPVVFDSFHYECYEKLYSGQSVVDDIFPEILNTWGTTRPKVHVSEQAPGKRVGAHSDYIGRLPPIFEIPGDFDIMVEAKMKELAVARLCNHYKVCSAILP